MGRPRMFDGRSERALVVPALVLAFAIIWAWAAVLAGGPMGGSVAAFLVAWVAMMAAMMLPSAAPRVLLGAHARSRGRGIDGPRLGRVRRGGRLRGEAPSAGGDVRPCHRDRARHRRDPARGATGPRTLRRERQDVRERSS